MINCIGKLIGVLVSLVILIVIISQMPPICAAFLFVTGIGVCIRALFN